MKEEMLVGMRAALVSVLFVLGFLNYSHDDGEAGSTQDVIEEEHGVDVDMAVRYATSYTSSEIIVRICGVVQGWYDSVGREFDRTPIL